MRTRIEKDGYSAELTDDLEIVFYGTSGRELKKEPRELKSAPERFALFAVRRELKAHEDQCRALARQWAAAGRHAPRALAEADPAWRRALDDEGVPLADERPDEEMDGALFARTYTGPLGVVRTQLLAEDLISYRDTLLREDGWEPDGLFATGIPDPAAGELPFPERALAAHPGLEALVLEKIRELRAETLDLSFPFKKDVDRVLADLDQTAPALLITLLDGMADLALAKEDEAVAAAWFGRARKLERFQAREVDQAWLDARYLTYAEGQALSATTLRERVRELIGTGKPGAATPDDVDRFRALVLARLGATGEVHPQLPTDVRKIAKAARLDPEETLAGVLHEIVTAHGISLDDDKLWQSVFKGRAMELLRARGPEAARAALRLRPHGWGTTGGFWRELLDRTGALALLTGEEPGLPDGEAARWLAACARHHDPHKGPPAELYELAELVAPRLKADGVPVEFDFPAKGQYRRDAMALDLVDVLLEHGAPVCDPPEALGPAYLNHVTSARPELAHLRADERYGRELRARVRSTLEMTFDHRNGDNAWYQPHESKGWRSVPKLFDNPAGHEEMRAWCARERERLRAGPDLRELVLLLGRFVHVGVVVSQVLRDADAAADFAAMDVLPPLMDELAALPGAPAGLPRERVEAVVGKLEPEWVTERVRTNRAVLGAELPELVPDEGATEEAYLALVRAANCRAGLASLADRLTPVDEKAAPAAPGDPVLRMCEALRELAGSGEPVWEGDPAVPTSRIEPARDFRATHAHAASLVLRTVLQGSRDHRPASDALRAYATYPFVAGDPGRWRVVRCDLPETPGAGKKLLSSPVPARSGDAFRTATSAAVVVMAGRDRRRILLEHAPDGAFCEGGPLAAAGATLVSAYVLEPQRPGAWFRRFAELYEERGRPSARPEYALALAEGTGLSAAEAAHVLAGRAVAAPHQDETAGLNAGHRGADLSGWGIREKDAAWAYDTLREFLAPDRAAALVERLLPDDPETLWTSGPDVARAVAWWQQEIGARPPVPHALVPLATKETRAPEGENPLRRERGHFDVHGEDGWPVLRLTGLLGRVASGAACLDPDASGLAGEPELLSLPRVAAWLAYRTPAGDPLRPAVGAAIGRLREELAAGPGPQHLFSLQSNYLMGAPPSTDALTAHEAVTVTEDETYDIRRLRVDPALLKGADDPLLDALDAYLDSVLPSQWLPTPAGLPALADLRLLLDDGFAVLGEHLRADPSAAPGGWEQDPTRSVPHLVAECAARHGLDEDAAALYLMLLALPDPTDRNVKQWTGWKPARFKAACDALDGTGLVVRTVRPRAGRTLFLRGPWQETKPPRLPVESGRRALLPLTAEHRATAHMAAVPSCPVPELFVRAWESPNPA
ncbi:hypothetical protein GCM10009801_03150 [Streptomyces albiaxialis]|uniref:DNA-binding protein n=1 Tax=Streptomyces albiaxialis TaxID=329523 RepID=A0ABN2VFH3_9ACTN